MPLHDNAGCPELDAARVVAIARREGVGVRGVEIRGKYFHPSSLPTSYVYVVGFDNYVKIGTAIDVDKRLCAIQTSVPVLLKIYAIIPHADRGRERELHRRFRKDRLGGEWFWLSSEVKAFIRKVSQPAIVDGPLPPKRLRSPVTGISDAAN